jgi:hypothetical protein
MSIKKYTDTPFSKEYNFKYKAHLEITADKIIFSTFPTTETEEVITGEQFITTVLFSELKNRYDSGGLDRWMVEINKRGEHLPLQNLYVLTASTKIEGTEYAKSKDVPSIFHIIVKPEDENFFDSSIIVAIPPISIFTCNKEFQEDQVQVILRNNKSLLRNQKAYLPKYSVLEKDRDNEKVLIQLNTPSNVNETFYAKTNAGYVPSQFKVINGIGKFYLVTKDMQEEETATVKIGLKFYSNLISIDIKK